MIHVFLLRKPTGSVIIETQWQDKKNYKYEQNHSKYATLEHKPTNVGRIALERQARQFNSGAVA